MGETTIELNPAPRNQAKHWPALPLIRVVPEYANPTDALDDVLAVDDGDAILMSQKLAVSLGLAVGISSGANFLGAVLAHERLGRGAVVVTLFADSNKKYLSTDLMRAEPVRTEFLSPRIKLLGFRAFARHCDFCPPGVRLHRSG